MDLHKLLSMAKKNQSEALSEKKIGYSTQVKAPKKLEKTVNPNAVKAFLNRKKEMEKIQYAENLKKKEELIKLREDKKTTKKAKAMATRTKDNLKIFHGDQTINQQHKKNNDIVLSPDAELKHKAFMKKLLSSNNRNSSEDSDETHKNQKKYIEKEKTAGSKRKKLKEKTKKAAQFDFKDLMNLAQKQSEKQVDESSSDESTDDDASSDEMSAEERYAREKRKRKQLEAQLKAMKRQNNNNSSTEPSFKIAKLDKGLSEESKQAKVKTLMEKFKQKSNANINGSSPTVDKNKKEKDVVASKFRNGLKPSHSDKSALTSQSEYRSHLQKASNGFSKTVLKSDAVQKVNGNAHRKQKDISFINQAPKSKQLSQTVPPKRASNPYAKLMEEANKNADRKCTLSVTSSVVRTNYPGVSSTDPKRPTYEKVKGPSKEMIEAFRRRQADKERGIPRRPQVFRDSDEYDSEMDGFIDDNDDEEAAPSRAISAAIGKIFGYDKNKYGRETEYELSKMDASYKDIEREEKRSLKIAKQEDALEAKRLLEEEEAKKKRRKKML